MPSRSCRIEVNRFAVTQPVRFSHCDPVGIVFFPSYFGLFNDLVEDWFNDVLNVGYADFIGARQHGLPTVKIDCEFVAPAAFGSSFELALSVARIGRSSLTLAFDGHCDGKPALSSSNVLVVTSRATAKAVDIPPDLRSAIEAFVAGKAPSPDVAR